MKQISARACVCVHVCMSGVPVGFWVTAGPVARRRWVCFRCFFLHLGLSCGSAAYPVCAQCCLRLMFAPSVTTSSAPAVKHQGLSQSHFLSLIVQICKREHIVLLHKTPVNPNFPSVSKIIQLIRLPSLISCLWDHKNQNFIGGWFPQALPAFYRGLYLCILCKAYCHQGALSHLHPQ